jgi:hypothetical protein
VEIINICNHDNIHAYECTDIPAYFVQGYYDKHPNAPSFCARCGEDHVFGRDIKVNATNPVYICSNNKCNGECNHALCKKHYNELNENNNGDGTKKRKRITKPINKLF